MSASRASVGTARVASAQPGPGGWGPPVAEGGADPPGPIPNPVVKRPSASRYCGSTPVGEAAAAGGPHPALAGARWRGALGRSLLVAGWSSGSSSGS